MRVLHAYNLHRGSGGSDKTTIATIELLRERGVDVDVFERDSRSLPKGLAGRFAAFAGGIYAAGAVREFAAQISERRPDLVHVHELFPLISPWVLRQGAAAGIPAVMTCNDFRLSCPIATHFVNGESCFRCSGGREQWCVIRNCRSNLAESTAFALRSAVARRFGLFARHVRRFVAISDYQRDLMLNLLNLEPSRVSVNYCAIRIPERKVDDPTQGSYVGFAGRFAPEKGVEVMVAACRLAKLPMRFAGDSDRHPAVGPDDDAEFVMTRSPAELATFYRGARVFVVPSVWPETFGIVAAEAMSHGIPVVASRTGGLQGSIRDGETGLLSEPGDAVALAHRIRQLWDDEDTARRIGAAAAAHAAEHFSRQAHFERLTKIYSEVLDGR